MTVPAPRPDEGDTGEKRTDRVPCPECGHPCKPTGLGAHRHHSHGIAGTPRSNYPRNKAWRLRNPEARNEGKQRNYNRGALGRRRPWTWDEDKVILDHEQLDRTLSFLLDRSVRAIHIRRSRLKAMGYRSPKMHAASGRSDDRD